MKLKLLFISLIVFSLAFQISPYARRIRPFASTPVSCQENEIGYNMTSHSLLICTNSGYTSIATGSGFTCAACTSNKVQKGNGAGNFTNSNITDDGTNILSTAVGVNSASAVNGANYADISAFSSNQTLIGTVGTTGVDYAGLKIAVTNRLVTIGDTDLTHGSTIVQINDVAHTIAINASSGVTVNGTLSVNGSIIDPTTNGTTDLGSTTHGVKQVFIDSTITAGGTTGAQTINKSAGSVNFAAGASTLVVTSNKATTSSLVFPIAATNDATCSVKSVTKGPGSFTINMTAACTAETRVDFWILNQ